METTDEDDLNTIRVIDIIQEPGSIYHELIILSESKKLINETATEEFVVDICLP